MLAGAESWYRFPPTLYNGTARIIADLIIRPEPRMPRRCHQSDRRALSPRTRQKYFPQLNTKFGRRSTGCNSRQEPLSNGYRHKTIPEKGGYHPNFFDCKSSEQTIFTLFVCHTILLEFTNFDTYKTFITQNTHLKKKPYVLGIDIGGTNTVFGIVDTRNRYCQQLHQDSEHSDINDYIDELYTEITRLIQLNDAVDKIHGIGIGAPQRKLFHRHH